MNKIYKIRDIETGLYSTGGMSPRWTRHGKGWTSLGALKLHLHQFLKQIWNNYPSHSTLLFQYGGPGLINNIPKNWEVVTFQIIEDESGRMDARSLYPDFTPDR